MTEIYISDNHEVTEIQPCLVFAHDLTVLPIHVYKIKSILQGYMKKSSQTKKTHFHMVANKSNLAQTRPVAMRIKVSASYFKHF